MRRNWCFGFLGFSVLGFRSAFCLWPFLQNFSRASLTLFIVFFSRFLLPSLSLVCVCYVLFISYLFVLIFGAVKLACLGFCTPRKRLKHVFELGSPRFAIVPNGLLLHVAGLLTGLLYYFLFIFFSFPVAAMHPKWRLCNDQPRALRV